MVPFYQTTTNRLARLLSCRNINSMSYPMAKIRNKLHSVKDPVGLKVPGVYRVPCGTSYVEWMGRLFSIKVTEHKRLE